MSIQVIINSQPYNYPEPGDLPGWGSDASDAFVALVNYVNGISPPTDIILTTASLADNVVVPTTITNLTFNSSLIYGAIVELTINRGTATELDTLDLVYTEGNWTMDRTQSATDTGVTFSITSGGQLQYTTTSTGTPATMVVRARSFPITV
jgi:hypothetical protein